MDKDNALEMEQTKSDDKFLLVLLYDRHKLSWLWVAYSLLKGYNLFR